MLSANTARDSTVRVSLREAATASRGVDARAARIIPIKWVRALPGSLIDNVIKMPPNINIYEM